MAKGDAESTLSNSVLYTFLSYPRPTKRGASRDACCSPRDGRTAEGTPATANQKTRKRAAIPRRMAESAMGVNAQWGATRKGIGAYRIPMGAMSKLKALRCGAKWRVRATLPVAAATPQLAIARRLAAPCGHLSPPQSKVGPKVGVAGGDECPYAKRNFVNLEEYRAARRGGV